MIWDISCAMDYGELIGVDSVMGVQESLSNALNSFQVDSEGGVTIKAVKSISAIVYTALKAGAETQGDKFTMSQREVSNSLLSADGVNIVTALVNCFGQYMPEQKETDEEVGKQMATS
jgi:hypothetical protein